MFSTIKKVHFVGIGGIGMSGIAEILINQGFDVSGSDISQGENTDYLASLGAKIYIGHTSENIHDAEVVVYSSAVHPDDNPETKEAMQRNIPVLRRAEMLAEVSRLNYCLAISGTHGKTTTTSIIGLMMMNAGFDPTIIVGGRLKSFGNTNARLGKGEWTVVEADEYDRSFLQLSPTIAVINNVEPEHLDIYKDFDDLKTTFAEFANKVPFYGFIALGLDDPGVKQILTSLNKKVVSFGLSRNSDIRAEDISFEGNSSVFSVVNRGVKAGKVTLNVPGVHNIKNALAAITVGFELGIDFGCIQQALSEFTGVNRRFEIKGEKNGVMIIDDYAHHPSEIRATLQAARSGWNRRIIAVFQPHTYTRTRDFLKDFGCSFDDSDVLFVTDVYAAREAPIEGINGKIIADAAVQYGHRNVKYCPDFADLYKELKTTVKDGDIVITLGAGDIWKISRQMMEAGE